MAKAPPIDLDVAVADFETAYETLLEAAFNHPKGDNASLHPRRPVANLGNLLIGALRSTQSRIVEASLDGILRLGSRRIRLASVAPEGAQDGNPGDLVVMDDGSAVWKKATGTGDTGWVVLGGGTDWTVAWEIDFSAEASQDFAAGGDDTYTIAGVDWTVANTAAAVDFEIINGTGLVIEHVTSSSTTLGGSTMSAPMLSAPWGSLWSALGSGGPRADLSWLLQAYIPGGLTGSSGSAPTIALGWYHDTGNDFQGGGLRYSGSPVNSRPVALDDATGFFDASSLALGNDVIGLVKRMDQQTDVLAGAWDSGWPALGDMHAAAHSDNNYDGAHMQKHPADAQMLIGLYTLGTLAGSPRAVVERVRMLVR